MPPKRSKVPKGVVKVKLKAITVYNLFIEGCRLAGLLDQQDIPVREWPLKLQDELQRFVTEDDRPDRHNYLRNKFNDSKDCIDAGMPDSPIGFYLSVMEPLLKYTGREDYMAFDHSFSAAPGTITIPVIYTPVVFGRFSIFRNPDHGIAHCYHNGDIVFEGTENLYIKKDALLSMTRHAMYGDPEVWIKLDYIKEGKPVIAYFAEINTVGEKMILQDPMQLLNFLEKHIS